MAGRHLSGRRNAVHPLAGLADHRRRHDPAGVRSVGVRDDTAARSLPARHVAVGLATVAAAGLQPDAARRRRRHQFLLAAVCRSGVDRVASGARRLRALGRVADRLCRRADRDQSGRQFAHARRAVRAGQRHHVRQRHGRGARHDADGIGQYAGDLAAHRAGVLSQFFAVFRLALADAVRCGAAVRHRLHQCGRAMVLDQGAAPGAGRGGDAVLLSDAGVVADDRISGLGRRSDVKPSHRLGDRGGDRAVPVPARSAAAAAAKSSAEQATAKQVLTESISRSGRRSVSAWHRSS